MKKIKKMKIILGDEVISRAIGNSYLRDLYNDTRTDVIRYDCDNWEMVLADLDKFRKIYNNEYKNYDIYISEVEREKLYFMFTKLKFIDFANEGAMFTKPGVDICTTKFYKPGSSSNGELFIKKADEEQVEQQTCCRHIPGEIISSNPFRSKFVLARD